MDELGSDTTLRRAPVVRIFDVGDRSWLLGPAGVARQLVGDSATLARVVLAFLATPRSGADLVQHLEALSGGPLAHAAVVRELVRMLVQGQAVLVGEPPRSR